MQETAAKKKLEWTETPTAKYVSFAVAAIAIVSTVFSWMNSLITRANEIPQLKASVKNIEESNKERDAKVEALRNDISSIKSDISWVREFLDPKRGH